MSESVSVWTAARAKAVCRWIFVAAFLYAGWAGVVLAVRTAIGYLRSCLDWSRPDAPETMSSLGKVAWSFCSNLGLALGTGGVVILAVCAWAAVRELRGRPASASAVVAWSGVAMFFIFAWSLASLYGRYVSQAL
jgi:hypothetical protein